MLSLLTRLVECAPWLPTGQVSFMKERLAHCSDVNDYSAERPRLIYAEGGRYLRVAFARSPGMEWNQEMWPGDRSKRGQCRGFSFGSRRRMLDRINQLSKAADQPDFVTLTYPDSCFEDSVCDFAKRAKDDLFTLLKRLKRACRSACGFWRIEWKARKSGLHEGKLFPHFHLLVWGLPERVNRHHPKTADDKVQFESFIPVDDAQQTLELDFARVLRDHSFANFKSFTRFKDRMWWSIEMRNDCAGRVKSCGLDLDVHHWISFVDWVSMAWFHVVGSSETAHFMAGSRVEKIRSWGGVTTYCTKYMSKADAESFLTGVATGRNWGIFNREFMPWAKMVQMDLTDEQGNRIRRIARRYLERQVGHRIQRHYGITLYCDVDRFKPLWAREPDTPF
jgi:hypothetical protein